MKLAVLFSGGKDSTYALYKAMQKNEIKYLVTIFPESQGSWMFHHPCIELTKLQAEALGIEQITEKTKGEKERELEDLRNVLSRIKNEIEGVVSGAVTSNYQKTRIDGICKELNLETLAPLWQREPEELLREEAESGFDIIMTGVSSDGFDKAWIGRRLDQKAIEDLKKLNQKFGVNICGEGGEYESLVLDCPAFSKKIKILDSEKVWDEKTSSGYLLVKKAILVDK